MNKTVAKRIKRRSLNSYINNVYFNNTKHSIHISIDYVTLSNIHPKKELLLYNILESNQIKFVENVRLQAGNYNMMRTHKNDCGDTVDILHDQKDLSKGFNTLLMKIRHPNEEIMSLLNSTFKYHEISPKVSTIEMSFDFYVDDVDIFQNMLKQHLFMKYQKSNSSTHNGEGNTFYTDNLRKSVKGMRLYKKRFETGQKVIRLELVLHRPVIQHLGLQFPLCDIDSLNLSKFFYFALLKENAVKKYFLWKNRTKLNQLKQSDPFEAEIILAHVDSWLEYPDSLMGKVEAVRDIIMIKNYSRFIQPLDNFNKEFLNIVSSQKFIPPRQKNEHLLKKEIVGV